MTTTNPAAKTALQVLEAIRATHPELIADNMPADWGLNKLREAFQSRPADEQKGFATGEWTHLFGAGAQETRCRIVVDLEKAELAAAQEWTGLKFEDVRGDRLKDLAESVIDVNDAHVNLADWGAQLAVAMPEWASQGAAQVDMQPTEVASALSGLDNHALLAELRRRGLVVEAWSADDFEFIGNEDENVIELGLSGEQLESIQAQAFEQARTDLGDIVTARGNDHLADWWGMNKAPILAQYQANCFDLQATDVDDSSAPGM